MVEPSRKKLKTVKNEEGAAVPEDWQSLNKQVTDRALFARRNGKYTDCVFHVNYQGEKKVFNAHRLMLCYSSCVFEAMLYGGLASEGPIVIEDITPDAFSALLDYAYTSKFNSTLALDIVLQLWYAAEKYQMKYLFADCENFLLDAIGGTNVGVVLNQARLLSSEKIEDFCWEVIRFETDFDQTDLFETLSKELLLKLLDKDELCIKSELQLFKGVEHRCQLECERNNLDVTTENMKAFGHDLLCKIRFLCFEPNDLSLEPAYSKLLSNEEKVALFANVTNVKKLPNVMPMPTGFSLCSETRKMQVVKSIIAGTRKGSYSILSATNVHNVKPEKLIDVTPGSVFNLSISHRVNFCIDKISFFDSEVMKKLVITNTSTNEVVFRGRTRSDSLVFEKELFFRQYDSYTFEVTLLGSNTACWAYRRLPSLPCWLSYHALCIGYVGQDCNKGNVAMKTSSDYGLIRDFSIAKATLQVL